MNLQTVKNLITSLNWVYNEERSDDNTFFSTWTKGIYTMNVYSLISRFTITTTEDTKTILFDVYITEEVLISRILSAMNDLKLDPNNRDA